MRAPSERWIGVVLLLLLAVMASTAAWGAVTGSISGTATDTQTKGPLSGANVSVPEAALTTVTDARGRFLITGLPPGTYSVVVSLVGYVETQVTDIVVAQGQTAAVAVGLEPTVVEAAGARAKVTAPKVTLRRDVTSSEYVVTAADEQMTLSQPNDRYQFPGLVFAQPGVVPDNTYYPHIRGARDNQVGYFLDGVPITEPNANVFATNIVSVGLDRLELLTGGYPAEYGGFTGGVINQVVKRGDQMRGRLLDIGAGTPYSFGGLRVETGDVSDRANWYYGLYTWHTGFNENLFTSSAPAVSDHIGKVILDVGERDKVTVLGAHGYARYEMPFDRMFTFNPGRGEWTTTQPGPDFGRQGHTIGAVTLNHRLSPTSFWTLRFSRVSHFLELELGDPDNAYWGHRNERMTAAQFDYQRQIGAHRLGAGLWEIRSDNESRYSIFGTQYSPFGLLDSVSNNDTRNTQAYLEDSWEVTRRLTLRLGGRYDKMTYDRAEAGDLELDETSARAGATYVVSPRFLLRGSAGRYVGFPRANLVATQFVPYVTETPDFQDWGLTWDMASFESFPVRPEIDRSRDLGFEWKVDDSTLLGATWFHRETEQMMQKWLGILHDADGNPVVDADGNFIPSEDLSDFDRENSPVWFAANGTATTRGVEVKVDRRVTTNTRAWLSYTLMDAKATSPADNVYPYGYAFLQPEHPDRATLAREFPVDWNQRRTITLAVRHQAGKLVVNPWLTMGSGFPYGQSGLDTLYGGRDAAHVWTDPSETEELVIPQNCVDPSDPDGGFISPNSLMTGKNLTVSLNLSYQIGPGREAYLDIYNVFDRRDVTSYVIYHPNTGALLGEIRDGAIYYVPFSRTPPRFFAFGIKQEF